MTAYLLVGMVALTVTLITTPMVRWLSLKIGAVDQPNDRKVHAKPTPTLGGLAIFLGIVAAGVVAFLMPDFRENFVRTSEPLGILIGAVIIFALGAVDDFHALPAPVKLSGQVFAAGVVFLFGVKMNFIINPMTGGGVSVGDDVSVLITVLWLVAMMNAVNLVDGLDGLAAGIVAIAAASFFVYTYEIAHVGTLDLPYSAPLFAIMIVGASLGFLRYNFHPARIFMGDSGAMLLGLVLGATTVSGVGTSPVALVVGPRGTSTAFLAYFPLLIPLAVLAIPILDSLFAIVRRARRRRSVFHADKEHIHHRLMDLGHGHRAAVLVMYTWAALAAGVVALAGIALGVFVR